jgi:hypothetical protein
MMWYSEFAFVIGASGVISACMMLSSRTCDHAPTTDPMVSGITPKPFHPRSEVLGSRLASQRVGMNRATTAAAAMDAPRYVWKNV